MCTKVITTIFKEANELEEAEYKKGKNMPQWLKELDAFMKKVR